MNCTLLHPYNASPTGCCLPSPCVQGSKSACPSASFPPTTSTDGTTWIATTTGLCVLYSCMDVGVSVSACGSLLPSPYFYSEVRTEITTVYRAGMGAGMGVCTCGCALVCMYKTDACVVLFSLWSV